MNRKEIARLIEKNPAQLFCFRQSERASVWRQEGQVDGLAIVLDARPTAPSYLTGRAEGNRFTFGDDVPFAYRKDAQRQVLAAVSYYGHDANFNPRRNAQWRIEVVKLANLVSTVEQARKDKRERDRQKAAHVARMERTRQGHQPILDQVRSAFLAAGLTERAKEWNGQPGSPGVDMVTRPLSDKEEEDILMLGENAYLKLRVRDVLALLRSLETAGG